MLNDPDFPRRLAAKRHQVAKARKAAEDAVKKADFLEAELRGWEQAANIDASSETNGSGSPKRGLSGGWKAVMAAMAQAYPKDFTLVEIGILAAANNIQAKPDTIRTQMHGYVESHYLDRTESGVFRVTAAGAAVAEVELGSGRHSDEDETAGADEAPAVT